MFYYVQNNLQYLPCVVTDEGEIIDLLQNKYYGKLSDKKVDLIDANEVAESLLLEQGYNVYPYIKDMWDFILFLITNKEKRFNILCRVGNSLNEINSVEVITRYSQFANKFRTPKAHSYNYAIPLKPEEVLASFDNSKLFTEIETGNFNELKDD